MSNAIKYSDKKDGLIQVGHADEGDRYRFYIKDNGPGISASDQDKIFKLFQTTENKSNSESDGSTGVGLNIVKLTIEEQGGKIWVDSVPGEGSCFNFTWMK
jgi:signal transduction histidine kinase